MNVPQVQADELKWKVKQIMEKPKLPKSNITKLERLATIILQRNDIIILPADKGNVTVVMDKTEYTRKLKDFIRNDSYSKVKKYPTMKTERKLSQILIKNKDHLLPKTYRQLSCYSKLPCIYGLLKIHKDGIPLKPIVTCQGSVCHPLNHFFVDMVDSLIEKLLSYLQNCPLHGNNQKCSHPILLDGEFVHQGTHGGGIISSQG